MHELRTDVGRATRARTYYRVHVRTYTCTHARMPTNIGPCVHCTRTCAHAHTHIYVHAHIIYVGPTHTLYSHALMYTHPHTRVRPHTRTRARAHSRTLSGLSSIQSNMSMAYTAYPIIIADGTRLGLLVCPTIVGRGGPCIADASLGQAVSCYRLSRRHIAGQIIIWSRELTRAT